LRKQLLPLVTPDAKPVIALRLQIKSNNLDLDRR
jgi:hypothetical protein